MTSGGGFGALDTMNKTLKNNRGLVKRIKVFDKIKPYSSSLKGKRLNISSQKLSKEQLDEIRISTLKEGRKQSLKQIAKIVVVLLVIVSLLFLIISGPLNRYGN